MKLHEEHELPIWRSKLIFPVNVEKYVKKAHTRGADAIVLDLEDAVAPADKASARTMVPDAARQCGAGGADVLVRINRPLELAVRDIETAVSPEVAALVLPKVDSDSHVRLLSELVDVVEAQKGMPKGHTKFAVLIETADAFWRMREIAGADKRVVAISLGVEDIALETHSRPDPELLMNPSQQIVYAACAAGILPLGVVGSIANYQDQEGYRKAIRFSRRMGFEGGSCIHPDIVPLLNEGFGYTDQEVGEAERILDGWKKANAEGRGSATVDGKMIDVPIVARAERVLRIAERIKAKARAHGGG